MIDKNKELYKRHDIVQSYVNNNGLALPEKTIFALLSNALPQMRMLDIGIGGGRTTYYFVPLVKDYVGTDYAEEMIVACKERFSKEKELSFYTCDVRDMSIFPDSSFDFILFSFNGLDYISHKDRLKALKDIQRVAKKDALFCFSSHNIEYLHKLFELKSLIGWNPKKSIRKIKKWQKLRKMYSNEEYQKLKSSQYSFFLDGSHDFSLKTYYIKPAYQIQQLENNGFSDIQLYSLATGEKIDRKIDLNKIDDAYIYYLCKAV